MKRHLYFMVRRVALSGMAALLGMAVLSAAAQDVVWEAKAGFRDFGKIVVANGVVVSGNITGKGGTFAFDANTGKLIWRSPGQMSAGPVSDGRVVYTSNAGLGTSAFDLKTGKLIWRSAEAKPHDGTDLLLDGGKVYVVGGYGKIWALDAATGKVAWEHVYFPGGYRGDCPTSAVAGQGMIFYVGGERGAPAQGVFLWALDGATGKEVWRVSQRGDCAQRPAYADGMLAVVSENVMAGVDAETGVMRWRTKPLEKVVDGREYSRPLSAPEIHGGRVYAVIEDGLLGWRLEDGRQEWEFQGRMPHHNYRRMLEFADGLVYFVANLEGGNTTENRRGFLYGLELATGTVKKRLRVNRDVQYESQWPTTYFRLDGDFVYYENSRFLAKARR